MWWFILACIFGGWLWGMSRAQLDRNQQMRNDALIDAVYVAGSNGDYDDSLTCRAFGATSLGERM